MKNVIIRAPLLSLSGYGTHSRQVFRWLLSRKDCDITTSIVPWGITPWLTNPMGEKGLVGEIMSRSTVDKNKRFDVSFQVQLPNEWDSNMADINIGISAVVETDICNPTWIECCNRMDMVIVPSEHAKSVLENTGKCTTNICVIPESYYDSISGTVNSLPLELSTDFNFLVFGQITGTNPANDRKNLFNTIKWLCETFKDDPDVGIVLKTNSGRNTQIDRRVTQNLLQKLLIEVRQGPYPKIHFLHGQMNQEEIAGLYVHPKIRALVSFTRGEGFGLPLLEAAASGLPIIATAWSGHMDFLKLGKFLRVNYSLQPIDESRVDNQIFMKGAKWANPIEESAKMRLSKFREKNSIPTQWANELKTKILNTYSQHAINEYYDKIVGIYF